MKDLLEKAPKEELIPLFLDLQRTNFILTNNIGQLLAQWNLPLTTPVDPSKYGISSETLGNAIKYICRAGYKSVATETQDLKKAIHYLENELKYLNSLQKSITVGSGDRISFSVWDSEQFGQPDYATSFDR